MMVRCLAANYIISYSPKAEVRSAAWLKQRYDYVKVNIDAGFDVDTLQGRFIRDHHEKFIAAANEKIDFCFDSFTMKAVAVRVRMNLTRTVGCSKIEAKISGATVS